MQLTPEQVAQFAEDGYLLLRGALTDADLDPIIAEYEEYIGHRAEELLAAGHISALYVDEPFDRRLISICREDDAIYRELDIMYLRGRASFEFLRNDRLLDMVESLVGPEITCSPIQHTRAKLPAGVTPSGSDPHVAPWHQDAGVTWEEADPHFILTVWLPLCAATPENGCLQILPRAHRNGLVQHHIKQGLGTVIIDEEMPQTESLTLPMDKGDVLLMDRDGRTTIGKMSPSLIAAWRKGKLVAQNQPLAELVAVLDRYFDGWIIVADRSLAKQPLTGIYTLTDPKAALQAMAQTQGATLREISPWVLVLSRH